MWRAERRRDGGAGGGGVAGGRRRLEPRQAAGRGRRAGVGGTGKSIVWWRQQNLPSHRSTVHAMQNSFCLSKLQCFVGVSLTDGSSFDELLTNGTRNGCQRIGGLPSFSVIRASITSMFSFLNVLYVDVQI